MTLNDPFVTIYDIYEFMNLKLHNVVLLLRISNCVFNWNFHKNLSQTTPLTGQPAARIFKGSMNTSCWNQHKGCIVPLFSNRLFEAHQAWIDRDWSAWILSTPLPPPKLKVQLSVKNLLSFYTSDSNSDSTMLGSPKSFKHGGDFPLEYWHAVLNGVWLLMAYSVKLWIRQASPGLHSSGMFESMIFRLSHGGICDRSLGGYGFPFKINHLLCSDRSSSSVNCKN